MSESGGLDVGKVIGMIMENPELVSQIAAMARSEPPAPSAEKAVEPEAIKPTEESVSTAVSANATYPVQNTARVNRTQLLGALKPYVSEERAKAIDSMLTIADILDMMRTR